MTTTQGIDVSGWSGNLDLDKIAAECAFVFMQATDGVGTIDKMLMPRSNALRGVGMGKVLGCYHFLRVRHGMKQDADEQCKQFLDARANAGCPLPAMLDIELGEPGSSNRAATHDEVRAALELFIETNDKCLGGELFGYTSPGEGKVMGSYLVDAFTALRPAIAEYVLAPGHAPATPPLAPKLPAPYTDWSLWQWAGNVMRFGGVVDLLAFNGTIDDLIAM
ncbi:MAG TPA: GH25 family lysozyme [Polyangiaceae bacterium]